MIWKKMSGTEEEKSEAFEICTCLAPIHSGAQYRLAIMYLKGIGVEVNEDAAKDLLIHSAPHYKKSEVLLKKLLN